ncbi:MAG: bifunctional DNA-formamidopyrimidine glycosylase/DNA-(apurinic or apyrimidinic site) lyase [Proteobacteria bacterium]|nr:bifunctional DNA-formamidopyrimidine glycosylase/DNA-(apurinic or apyrimidinic site) lyase [Pseudomonadota bacterium]
MPELPEVETTKRGITPFVLGQKIEKVIVRNRSLRYLIDEQFAEQCQGKEIQAIERRSKYLLFSLNEGNLINHLGMSGHLRVVSAEIEAAKHDHLDLILSNGSCLRYNDPRRFGLWLYQEISFDSHPLLAHLGPEPLTDDFNTNYLLGKAKNKQQNIKTFIMNNNVVVGVGNIYASESLFLAKIHPEMKASALTPKQAANLVDAIKIILAKAIEAGGTTLRDFYKSDGKPGYFSQDLKVYGRKDLACTRCNHSIQSKIITGRNSYFCSSCQK